MSYLQMDLIDNYRIFYLHRKEYVFFPVQGTFSKISHIFNHKTSLNRQKIEITPCILTDLHRLKLDFNNKSNRKLTNSYKLNTSLLNNFGIKAEIKQRLFRLFSLIYLIIHFTSRPQPPFTQPLSLSPLRKGKNPHQVPTHAGTSSNCTTWYILSH